MMYRSTSSNVFKHDDVPSLYGTESPPWSGVPQTTGICWMSIPQQLGCFTGFDSSPYGNVSKPIVPLLFTSKFSWDLWMFIPLKIILIGIDSSPYCRRPYTHLLSARSHRSCLGALDLCAAVSIARSVAGRAGRLATRFRRTRRWKWDALRLASMSWDAPKSEVTLWWTFT